LLPRGENTITGDIGKQTGVYVFEFEPVFELDVFNPVFYCDGIRTDVKFQRPIHLPFELTTLEFLPHHSSKQTCLVNESFLITRIV